MEKKYKWYKIADELDEIKFSENGLAEWEVNGKKICLSLFKEELCATSLKCPHAGGNLSHGYLDATGNIACPLHRYKFSCKTGRNVSGEGFYLKTFPVEKRLDGYYVGIEESGIFNWLK